MMRSWLGPTPIGIDASELSRRQSLTVGAGVLFGSSLMAEAALAGSGQTTPVVDGSAGGGAQLQTVADYIAVTDVLLRERLAREIHDPAEEAACFHPDATVAVSWFKGSAARFLETGKEKPSTEVLNFDSMSPAVIAFNRDRAIADASCAVHTYTSLDGVEVGSTSFTRLLWRLQKLEGRWLISRLDCIYIRDDLWPRDPSQALKLDLKKLSGHRTSYRFLSYILLSGGRPCYDDLPGVDRPETVVALRTASRAWLDQG